MLDRTSPRIGIEKHFILELPSGNRSIKRYDEEILMGKFGKLPPYSLLHYGFYRLENNEAKKCSYFELKKDFIKIKCLPNDVQSEKFADRKVKTHYKVICVLPLTPQNIIDMYHSKGPGNIRDITTCAYSYALHELDIQQGQKYLVFDAAKGLLIHGVLQRRAHCKALYHLRSSTSALERLYKTSPFFSKGYYEMGKFDGKYHGILICSEFNPIDILQWTENNLYSSSRIVVVDSNRTVLQQVHRKLRESNCYVDVDYVESCSRKMQVEKGRFHPEMSVHVPSIGIVTATLVCP